MRAAFGALQIEYDERVLEPRAWTALQSRWAVELLEDAADDAAVLELCTGAGHIGLLAAAESGRRLVAVDVDPAACDFARANAERAGLVERVEVRCGPLQEAVRADERFAVVIADPPWVESGSVATFPEDPVLAIDGGADGLDLARACAGVAAEHLELGGTLLLQLGTAEQCDTVAHESSPALVESGRREGERGWVLALHRRSDSQPDRQADSG